MSFQHHHLHHQQQQQCYNHHSQHQHLNQYHSVTPITYPPIDGVASNQWSTAPSTAQFNPPHHSRPPSLPTPHHEVAPSPAGKHLPTPIEGGRDQLSQPLGDLDLNSLPGGSQSSAAMSSRARRKTSAYIPGTGTNTNTTKQPPTTAGTSRPIRTPSLSVSTPSITTPSSTRARSSKVKRGNAKPSRGGAVFLPSTDDPDSMQDTDDALTITLKNTRGPLLPAPPGSFLEVNDLLILHPPSLSPNGKAPLNQYTAAAAAASGSISAGEGLAFGDGYQSQYEMYTCRLCSKTYDGKNARSVARRHLQDKHGVPLSFQKRRSRWDYAVPEKPPKDEGALRARTLKSKRAWASRNRQQTKLEKTFAAYLSQFGPPGLVTPDGLRLIAPDMRGQAVITTQNQVFPSGELAWEQMPADLVEGIKAIGTEDAAGEGKVELEVIVEGKENDNMEVKAVKKGGKKKAGAKTKGKAGGPVEGKVDQSSKMPSTLASAYNSPNSKSSRRTALSESRSYQQIEPTEGQYDQGYYQQQVYQQQQHQQWYGSATHIDDGALQAALAHHYADQSFNAPPTSDTSAPSRAINSSASTQPPLGYTYLPYPNGAAQQLAQPVLEDEDIGDTQDFALSPESVDDDMEMQEIDPTEQPPLTSGSMVSVPSQESWPSTAVTMLPFQYWFPMGPSTGSGQAMDSEAVDPDQGFFPVFNQVYPYQYQYPAIQAPTDKLSANPPGQHQVEIDDTEYGQAQQLVHLEEAPVSDSGHQGQEEDEGQDEEGDADMNGRDELQTRLSRLQQSPHETVAAESLLDLRSTPARPSTDPSRTRVPSTILRHVSTADDTPARPSSLRHSISDPMALAPGPTPTAHLAPEMRRSESESVLSAGSRKVSPLLEAAEIRAPSGSSRKTNFPDSVEIDGDTASKQSTTPRPRPTRAMSMVGNGQSGHAGGGSGKSRPTALSRSISFGPALHGMNIEDDPFAMSPVRQLSKRQRSTIASPSPTVKRKKEEGSSLYPPFSRFNDLGGDRDEGMIPHRRLLDHISENEGGGRVGPFKGKVSDPTKCPVLAPELQASPVAPAISTSSHTIGGGATSTVNRAPLQLFPPNRRDSLNGLTNTIFKTPSRPGRPSTQPGHSVHEGGGGTPLPNGLGAGGIPTSLSKVWLLSSPGNGETAASLGLAPQWGGLLGFGTPGVSVGGGDTPRQGTGGGLGRWSVVRRVSRDHDKDQDQDSSGLENKSETKSSGEGEGMGDTAGDGTSEPSGREDGENDAEINNEGMSEDESGWGESQSETTDSSTSSWLVVDPIGWTVRADAL